MRGLSVTAVLVGSSRSIPRLIFWDDCTILHPRLCAASTARPIEGQLMITQPKLRAFLHCAITLGQMPREHSRFCGRSQRTYVFWRIRHNTIQSGYTSWLP